MRFSVINIRTNPRQGWQAAISLSMAEKSVDEVKEEEEEEEKGKAQEEEKKLLAMSRKEKRKEKKKMKRKQVRRELAEKEREEEERKLNDPEEQRRAKEMQEEEIARMEKERKEFEESERKWMEVIERKRKEEEESRKIQEEEEEEARRLSFQSEKENDLNEDDGGDDWEFVEEGPAEIIWQGNEITVRKKKVRVPKKNADGQSRKEDDERPTSNPLPPQSEAFAEYQNASVVSAQQMLENVAQQVPNFGTEQDKAHCPFHLKTGACRFGQRCSRVHFYPDKSCTLLIKNMYSGPGLAWEQDEGLEYTDEEVERSYEEFYEDVHTEFLKYGEIVNFKVCKNGSFHLRGNVYVHYKSLESAVVAYQSLNGRYFAGKQVKCEFVSVTKWKVAICGEYMRSRLKTCSHGTACNFIHCFRNPGGDYEWADWDKPPPRYWMKKMAALFGLSHDSVYEKQVEQEKLEQWRLPSKMLTMDRDRHHRTGRSRSRSRDMDRMIHSFDKSSDIEDDAQEGTHWQRRADNAESNSDGDLSDRDRERDRDRDRNRNYYRDRDRNRNYYHARKRSRHQSKASEHSSDYGDDDKRYSDIDPNDKLSDEGRNRHKHYACTQSSGLGAERPFLDVNRGSKNDAQAADGYQLEKHHDRLGGSSRHRSKGRSPDDLGNGKSRMLDVESSREWSHRYRDKNHERISRRPRNQTKVLELPDDRWENRSRTDGADSSDDLLERDRGKHCSRGRKSLRHDEPEFSNLESAMVKRLREKPLGGKSHLTRNPTGSHSTIRNCLSRENDDVNYPESLRPDVNHEYGHLKQYSGRCESCDPNPRSNSIAEIDDLDRWKPEGLERDQNCRRKSAVIDGYEFGNQCDTRSEFHDTNTGYSNKKMDREGAQEYEKDASDKYPESRSDFTVDDDDKYGTSSLWEKNSVKLCNESRSRDSSRSRHKRHSNCVE